MSSQLNFYSLAWAWRSDIEYRQLASAECSYHKAPYYIFRTVTRSIGQSKTQLLVLHQIGCEKTHVLVVAKDINRTYGAIVLQRSKKLFPYLKEQQRVFVNKLLSTVLNSDIGPLIKIFRENTHQHVAMNCSVAAWSSSLRYYNLRAQPKLMADNTHMGGVGLRHLVCVIDTTLDLEHFEMCRKFLLRLAKSFSNAIHDRRPILVYLTVYTSPPFKTVVTNMPLAGSTVILTLARELERVRLLEPEPELVASTIAAVSSVIRNHRVCSDYLLCCRYEVLMYYKEKAGCTNTPKNPFPVPIACLCTEHPAVSWYDVRCLLGEEQTKFGVGPYSWAGVFKVFYGAYFDSQNEEFAQMQERVLEMPHRRLVNRQIAITFGDQFSIRIPFVASHEGSFYNWMQNGAAPLSDVEYELQQYGIDVPLSCEQHQFVSVQWGSLTKKNELHNPSTQIVLVKDPSTLVRRSLTMEGDGCCALAH